MGILYRSGVNGLDKKLNGELSDAVKKAVGKSMGEKTVNNKKGIEEIKKMIVGKTPLSAEKILEKKLGLRNNLYHERKRLMDKINPRVISVKSDDLAMKRRAMANIKYTQRQRMMEEENSLNLNNGNLQTKIKIGGFASDYKPGKPATGSKPTGTPNKPMGLTGLGQSSVPSLGRPNLPF